MLQGLWTIGIKVANLEQELTFHRGLGNPVVLDETVFVGQEAYRLPLVRMGDKYLHLAEKMVYERFLDKPLPLGIVHLVYRSNEFAGDLKRVLECGASMIGEVALISAGFGDRNVAFLRSPSGWVFEIIEVLKDLVPMV